ncbi:MAG: DUF2268 domain-containing putative Zn-dependent protease [Vicinamibacterales bacterium]
MRHRLTFPTAGLTLLIAAVLTWAPRAAQQILATRDPDAARLVTSDIQNFWRAFDAAPVTNIGALAAVFEREYFDAGSPGLRDFVRFRIETARALAEAVAARRRYYAAIRETTLALDTNPNLKESIRGAFHRLKNLYPEAVFPDVYFLIGRLSTGGTASSAGLLIAVEMNARGPGTPMNELSDWERATIGQVADLRYVVAHELVHVQQRIRRDGSQTLLTNAIGEGAADFVGELISGRKNGNRVQHAYGNARERALWEEFRREMHGTDSSRWLGQADRAVGRPADLGYYVGYKICEALYQAASDKTDAVRTILQITDADAFLRLSHYSGGGR